MANVRKPYRRYEEGPLLNERVLRLKVDIRVIDSEGQNLGTMSAREALTMAKDRGLDLVAVSTESHPPVCKICDHGRQKYLTEKLKKETKKKQLDIKGIVFRPNIAEHDLGHLLKNAHKFLVEGHKVKVTCRFRAREITHPEIGRRKMDNFALQLNDCSAVETPPKLEGKLMMMILTPKASSASKKNVKIESESESQTENVQDSSQEI